MRFGFENRLRLAREIEFLKQNSMKADCSAFIVYILPARLRKDFTQENKSNNILSQNPKAKQTTKELETDKRTKKLFSRVAIVASKRIGNAVVRNRARRIFREVFRAVAPELSEPLDTMIFVRRGWAKFSQESLREKFSKACSNASLKFKKEDGLA